MGAHIESHAPAVGVMPATASPSNDVMVTSVVHETVAEVSLCNGKLNLVTRSLLQALNCVLIELSRRDDVRCVILHGGESRAFCAGSDIKEFDKVRDRASEQKILFEDLVLRTLARLPMPTIAAIDGPALGGGLELALCCDLRILQEDVRIGLPESRLGGLAGNGSVRLTRLVGPARAKEMLFTGDPITSAQALAWGLVNRVSTGTSALNDARELAAEIAQRGPVSNRLAKELVEAALDVPLDAALSRSTVAQQEIFDSQDLREGAEAFLAKRAPIFKGR